ncbi:hypothetical protein PPERSA_03588 [Pseudocohnilembus persalinus]|uniref:Suppressor of forked domain-containing protein n=1 Tax=Pseudocohnilembus persalinus TaxID=266149 RepID=A0A0V0QQ73_PSEPJ|nr:hypothetical protein PPERSA_03588 [Pseudocohnilembus persalinus]|eukprot:KRX04348.1 hypothetical protein PPERSA_03588 [Pseudocohnilembus persalinus]
MWLALAKLETYQKAREVLNRARNILPMEASFWIAAAKLEESVGKDQQLIDKVILKGIKVLQQNKAQLIQAALDFEIGLDKEGQDNELIEIINKSVELHPQDEELWIECIKSLWNKKEEVKKLIERAIEAMPQNENILLYASKKEREEGNIEKAREYLLQ